MKSNKPMTALVARTVITDLFLVLKRECERGAKEVGRGELVRLFDEALEASRAGETHNRKHAWVKEGRYRNTIETAARYFVLRWWFDPATIRSARDAVSVRLDCLYASALSEAFGPDASGLFTVEQRLEFERIDYADHIAAPPP